MKGLTQYEGVAVDRLRTATREAFSKLIRKAVAAQPAFVIIAGDLYDGDWKDYNTGFFFLSEMRRLGDAGVPAYVLYGNHDAQSQLTKRLRLPDNVFEFDHERVQSHQPKDFDVILHGRSYPVRDVQDNLCHEYPPPTEGLFNIGVLHTGLGGLGGHANYAPCSLEQLVNTGYEYWALGHVHTRQVLNENPHVVFPGNLQGRHINEDGPRSASLVTVEEGRVVDIEEWECDVVRWHRIEVDVEDCVDSIDVLTRVDHGIAEYLKQYEGEHTNALRIRLLGTTPMHGSLASGIESLTRNIRASSLNVGGDGLWIERVDVATRPPEFLAQESLADESVDEMRALLRGAADDPDLAQRLQQEFEKLTAKLQSELKTDLEDGERGFTRMLVSNNYQEILAHTVDRVMAEVSRKNVDAD